MTKPGVSFTKVRLEQQVRVRWKCFLTGEPLPGGNTLLLYFFPSRFSTSYRGFTKGQEQGKLTGREQEIFA